MSVADLTRTLSQIGAIQFGQFESAAGTFQPLAINLRLLPSYPLTLHAVAQEIAPLVQIAGLTHLLTTPAATPIGVAASLITGLPLVYPAADDPRTIEGAYNYAVPTVLLTDVMTDGKLEQTMIAQVRSLGLYVQAVVVVIDLDIRCPETLLDIPVNVWMPISALLAANTMLTASMRAAVQDWLAQQRH